MSGGVIVGIGSDRGVDRIGLAILARLAKDERVLRARVGLHSCRAPAAVLPAVLPGARWAILVDALRGAGTPGRAQALTLADLVAAPGSTSSHGIGVAQTLALLSALGQLPEHTVLVAVNVGLDGKGPVHPGWVTAGRAAVLAQLRRLDGPQAYC